MQKSLLLSSFALLCAAPLAFSQEPGSSPTSQPAASSPTVTTSQSESRPFDLSKAKDSVDQAVGAAEIAAHIQYLASDELEGRFTGSKGGELAAVYLAETLAQLEPYGLKPGGDGGTYLQDIQLKSVEFEGLPVLKVGLDSNVEALTYGSEFELVAGLLGSAALDVIVVSDVEDVRLDTPNLETAIYFAMGTIQRRNLMEARGPMWQAKWGAILIEGSKRERKPMESPARIRNIQVIQDEVALPVTFKVHGARREALENGEISRMEFAVMGRQPKAYNVIAILPGKNGVDGGAQLPTKVSGAIVMSAHYDHLRKRELREGDPEDLDVIFNGADDDASGVAAVLEIVEAIAIAGNNERDLVVLLATGEEIGLVGTSYYLDHPLVPLERTLCNLNFEMIGRSDPAGGGFGKLWLTGYDYTGLGPALAEKDLSVVRDPYPSEHYYERSDNYAFVLKGIVGQSFSSYNGHDDYHHASDETEGIEFWHMETAVRACAQAVSLALDYGFEIEWTNGYTPPRR